MVAGVSLLLRALPLLLWGCQDTQPTQHGHPELRQEAEVEGCAWRRGGRHPRSPLSNQLCPFALTAYKKTETGQGYSLSQNCWDHTGLQSLID